ncbi:hypothetical protein [Siansivirga zeaxanthinifaciens]|uniref:Uncharacterized protein n=1 Tax=Siansivirga zeaxanthinifaciens CC-SAMT-1 TaxID=1454006 RepID=A0A0C5W8A0_9FLAO|nr:hypothetical protein [Siansivirga zeaxanthinifaciens]AJR03408.1 hypothetical protein AW14_06985 [Siansivirga zeaxanthinifaciens CC-SAMT-1]
MNTICKRLKLQNYKDVYILNKPDSFLNVFNEVDHSESIVTTSYVECALVFVDTKEDFVNQMSTLFPRLMDNSILWVFYPNETSISEFSKLHIEFDWDFLGDYRLKPTKLFPVDAEWNALKIKKILI